MWWRIVRDVVGPFLIALLLLTLYAWASNTIAPETPAPTQGQMR